MPQTNPSTAPPHIQRVGENDETVVNIEALDLEALAEEVVKLLKQELRVENERRGWHRVW